MYSVKSYTKRYLVLHAKEHCSELNINANLSLSSGKCLWNISPSARLLEKEATEKFIW